MSPISAVASLAGDVRAGPKVDVSFQLVDADEIRRELVRWRRAYNERRPHQALAWRTPTEAARPHERIQDVLAQLPMPGEECLVAWGTRQR